MDQAVPPQSPQKQERHDQRLGVTMVDCLFIEPHNGDSSDRKKRQTRQRPQATPPPTPPAPRRHGRRTRRTPRIKRSARVWSDDRLEVAQILLSGCWRCNGCLLRRVCAAPFLLEGHDHRPLLINRQGARCHGVTALLRGPERARFAVRLVVDAHTVIIPHRMHTCVHLTPSGESATTSYPANTAYRGASLRQRLQHRVHAP